MYNVSVVLDNSLHVHECGCEDKQRCQKCRLQGRIKPPNSANRAAGDNVAVDKELNAHLLDGGVNDVVRGEAATPISSDYLLFIGDACRRCCCCCYCGGRQ